MFRIGFGTDLHRLEAGRHLVLGGVCVSEEIGAVAHSDGDALIHAIIDALLGAAALGDIGEHFPDNDPAYRGADSRHLLEATLTRVRAKGYRIGNLDCTIHLQKPKLKEFKTGIRKQLASLLEISENQVNIKAKTGEKVGPVGEEKAVAADAIILLLSSTKKV